jgi:hypothetical protein
MESNSNIFVSKIEKYYTAILHAGKFADPKIYDRFKGPEEQWYQKMTSSK